MCAIYGFPFKTVMHSEILLFLTLTIFTLNTDLHLTAHTNIYIYIIYIVK